MPRFKQNRPWIDGLPPRWPISQIFSTVPIMPCSRQRAVPRPWAAETTISRHQHRTAQRPPPTSVVMIVTQRAAPGQQPHRSTRLTPCQPFWTCPARSWRANLRWHRAASSRPRSCRIASAWLLTRRPICTLLFLRMLTIGLAQNKAVWMAWQSLRKSKRINTR